MLAFICYFYDELTKEDEYGIISRTMMEYSFIAFLLVKLDFEQLLEMQEKLNVVIEPAAPAKAGFNTSDSPCPSCGKHIVIRPKVISVPDVNLKSGIDFLVRKSPEG